MNILTILILSITTMIIVILTTIKFKIKSPIRKVHSKTGKNPPKLNLPMKIFGYVIYVLAALFVIFLIILIGPWVWYYIEMHY